MKIQVHSKLPKAEMDLIICQADKKIKGQNLKLAHAEYALVHHSSYSLFFALEDGLNENEIVLALRALYARTKNQWSKKINLSFSGIKVDKKAVARALYLTTYNLAKYKTSTEKKLPEFSLTMQGSEADGYLVEQAKIEADSQMWAMDLVDTPPEDKTPEKIAEKAVELGKTSGFDVEVWNSSTIVEKGLNAIHAVGRGSNHPPVFIHCTYKGKANSNKVDLVLLGKGVSFDTGGISIKPGENLHFMKSDMAGAAAVLGTIASIARMKIAVNLSVIVPAAENNVASGAMLPGEVIKSYSGKTIEVINTDAEGRLILADALAWTVKHLKPACMIDCATLTGSAVRALGNEAAALYSSDSNLSRKICFYGQKTGEKLWPMPLWKDYDHYLHSDVADVSNLPAKPIAGSIAAAKFLEVFTDNHNKWAHIDMPGVAFMDNPESKSKSATGYGVQLLTNFTISNFG